MFALQWRDIDLDNGTVVIKKSMTPDEHYRPVSSETKTPTGVRCVPLGKRAAAALSERLHASKVLPQPDDYVFLSPKGRPIRRSNFIRRFYHPLLTKAKLPRIPFHKLRHVFATLLIEKGENPKVVQTILGHASSRVTMDIYAHARSAGLRSAAHIMDGVLEAPEEPMEGSLMYACLKEG